MIVANRNAAGVYSPVPKPVANGTLKSMAEIGAAPVTATKITPISPTAFGFSRSTPAVATETDSTVPWCWTRTSGSGFVVAILALPLSRPSCPTALRIEPSRTSAWQHDPGRLDDLYRSSRPRAHHDARTIGTKQILRALERAPAGIPRGTCDREQRSAGAQAEQARLGGARGDHLDALLRFPRDESVPRLEQLVQRA